MMRRIFILSLALAAVGFAKSSWRPLFDGKTFKGWHIAGSSSMWTVKDSAIVGFSSTPTQYSMVFSDSSAYDQFTVKYSYRLKAGCSGFFFRSKETSTGALVEGCQVEAKYESFDATHSENQFGNIYCWPTNAWQTFTKAPFWVKAARAPDQFQDVILTIKRPYAYVNMNGFQAVGASQTEITAGANAAWDYTTGAAVAVVKNAGKFALQIHDGQPAMDVAFKNISILEGCGDTASANYDGKNIPGLPEQPAVYQNSAENCAGTSIEAPAEYNLKGYIGALNNGANGMTLRISYPGAHSLEIISVKGKVVFSGSAPSAFEYRINNHPKPGIYFAKVQAGKHIATQRIAIP